MGSVMSFFPSKMSKEELEMALNKAKEIASSSPAVVFSKTYCGYCTRVKNFLTQLGASYRVFELDNESDGAHIQTALAEWTGLSTVPNVFIGGKHIGGCDTVLEKYRAGQLVPLLVDTGAIAHKMESSKSKEEMEAALNKAKEIVSSSPVVVFSKTYCGYCKRVKDLLKSLGATYKVVELDTESDGDDIHSALIEWTGQRTVPNVFIGGNHIGGCDTVLEKHKAEQLVPLLNDAGAIANNSAQL